MSSYLFKLKDINLKVTPRRLQFDVKRNAWANTSSALNEERRKGAEAITSSFL